MEERLTLCNMVIEPDGKNGVVPADDIQVPSRTNKLGVPLGTLSYWWCISSVAYEINHLEKLSNMSLGNHC